MHCCLARENSGQHSASHGGMICVSPQGDKERNKQGRILLHRQQIVRYDCRLGRPSGNHQAFLKPRIVRVASLYDHWMLTPSSSQANPIKFHLKEELDLFSHYYEAIERHCCTLLCFLRIISVPRKVTAWQGPLNTPGWQLAALPTLRFLDRALLCSILFISLATIGSRHHRRNSIYN